MCLKRFLFRSAAIFLDILLVIVIIEILARFFYQEPWYEKPAKTQRRSEKLDRSKISIRYTDNVTNAYLGDNKQTQAWYLKEI